MQETPNQKIQSDSYRCLQLPTNVGNEFTISLLSVLTFLTDIKFEFF